MIVGLGAVVYDPSQAKTGDILCDSPGAELCYDTATAKYLTNPQRTDLPQIAPTTDRIAAATQNEAQVRPKTRIKCGLVAYAKLDASLPTNYLQECFSEDLGSLAVGVAGNKYTLLPMTAEQRADYQSRIKMDSLQVQEVEIDPSGVIDNPGQGFAQAYEQVRAQATAQKAASARTAASTASASTPATTMQPGLVPATATTMPDVSVNSAGQVISQVPSSEPWYHSTTLLLVAAAAGAGLYFYSTRSR